MTTQRRPNLLANLRALDEHYQHVEPNPAFERRLQNRLQNGLQAKAQKKSSSITPSVWLRKYGRPMAIAVAACLVLILSVSEQAPPARSGLIVPHASDAAVDPIETPLDEQIEQAKPHRQEIPQTPLTSSPEPSEPAPIELREEFQPVFPALPENETDSERNPIERRRNLVPPFSNTPHFGARESSDGFGFWSPAQALPIDPQSRSSGTNGEWGSGGPSRPKGSPTAPPRSSSPSACVAKEILEKNAIIDCEESGLVLTDIMYLNPCEDGLYQHAEHECAESPADDETCTTDTLTSGDVCMDPSDLKMWAHKMCLGTNSELVDFTYVTDGCGSKARKATYTCCPLPPEPAPPPPVCQYESIGDGVTCKDAGLFKDEAYWFCNKLGQTIADIQLAFNCPNNQATMAKIMCCK